MRPPHRCSRCGQQVSGKCACRPAWSGAGNETKRIRGRKLQDLRTAEFVRAQGKCAGCGRVTALEDGERDHIQGLAEGGSEEQSNTQWLCVECNAAKRAKESARGRMRR